ncbi:MAG: PD-(D/E)XK nuclease family transposase [Candidatus Electrothrix aestuarii]|uniref:PD-(D/E)XK nuclease family transposase n=1 Tax=Candidatus Electrothrix aestuarii TaxID=3062594 RepID=A0AAU8LVY1_9BACT|nr:PD-(D/E)XK nuclease family transposase [Candidatus Electrothrix aestuarii]
MPSKERYVNLFADYGFKKIFGEEPNKNLLLDFLNEQLFTTAEIARFTPDQVRSYEKSLKYYRDMKNSLDTAFDEGREEGLEKGKEIGIAENQRETVIRGLKQGLDKKIIADLTGLSMEAIEKIAQEIDEDEP